MSQNDVYVPVKDTKTGEIIKEPWNNGQKQSDGSTWHIPKPLISEDHVHYLKIKDPRKRFAECECGFGGPIYPHNCIFKDGKVYRLNGIRVI